MAKGFGEIDSLCRELVNDARNGIFKPVYLLMGDEPYYVDMVCDAIVEHCLDESERISIRQYVMDRMSMPTQS